MAFTLLKWIAIISISYANCGSSNYEREYKDTRDLRYFLNWINEFSKEYELKREKYDRFLLTTCNTLELTEYAPMTLTYYDFVHKVSELRDILVNGFAESIIITDDIDVNTFTVFRFIRSMAPVFDDLKAQIKIWERREEGMPAITKVTDPGPFEWFENHGFSVLTLNDTSIEELEELVLDLHGPATSYFTKILKFHSTVFFLTPEHKLSSALAWIATFVSSGDALFYVQLRLNKSYSHLPSDTNLALINVLRKLGSTNSPLLKFISKRKGEGLYPVYMDLYRYAVFSDRKASRYLDLLVESCFYLLQDLLSLSVQLDMYQPFGTRFFLRTKGFIISKAALAEKNLGDQINSLISEDGLIKILCDVVKQYDRDICDANLELNFFSDEFYETFEHDDQEMDDLQEDDYGLVASGVADDITKSLRSSV